MLPLTSVKGVGEKTAQNLATLGIDTPQDLLLMLPKTYLDFTQIGSVNDASLGDFVLILAKITKKSPLIKKNGKTIAVFRAQSDGANIRLVFFSQDYLLSTLKVGLTYRIYGKLLKDNGYYFSCPKIEQDGSSAKLKGIVPVYSLKGLIPQNAFRNLIKSALAVSPLSPASPKAEQDMPLLDALTHAHFPTSFQQTKQACERIVLEKVLLELQAYRASRGDRAKHRTYSCPTAKQAEWKQNLPFTLNDSQSVAIATIIDGICTPDVFRGVLTGDVGSGKTVVFLLSALFAVQSGYQVALMAPTELVAEQHAQTARKFLVGYGVRVALLTSSVKGKARTATLHALKNKEIDLIIGTQSLLSDEVQFHSLALIGVDEQHRFGVVERDRILKKNPTADTLFLSATPIPRTLHLLYLGAFQSLSLTAREGSKTVKTRIVTASKQQAMFQYLSQNAQGGSRSYIVAPQISDTELQDCVGAEELYTQLQADFPNTSFGLVTGKMNLAQKSKVIEQFRQGKVSILVATTVVEVGLDVPEADAVVVMHAERFGLASLHQLRGRVGRGGQEAYCFLYTEREEDCPRLNVLTQMSDGIKIAEADFALRGAGELVGSRQHGKDTALAGVTEDILQKARSIISLKIY